MNNKSVSLFVIYLIFFNVFNPAWAQKVTRVENFDAVQFLPLGWTGARVSGIDVNNYTERVSFGTAPSCAPHSGAGMVRYRSGFMFNAGEQYYMASPRYDLTNNPGTATVSFWIYRDNTQPTFHDSVTLYINNNPTANASRVKVTGPISRVSGSAGAWVKYSSIIPAGFNHSSAYLVFVFTNRQTSASANIYIDDFTIETYPKPQQFVSSSLFYQETYMLNKGANDQIVVGIKVICDGAGDSLKVDSVVTNATGTSSIPNDIVLNSLKLWYTKGTSVFNITTGNQFGVNLTPTYFRDRFTQSNFYLENGENYFWVTLSTSPSATTGNFIDIEFPGFYYRKTAYTGIDTSQLPLVTTLPGNRIIGTPLCNGLPPTLIIGTSFLNGSYTNNDYIRTVYLRGANTFAPSYPYINNNINDAGPWGTPDFFTVHPPSYQQMPPSASLPLHPNITAVLAQGISYPTAVVGPAGPGMALQCGTWSNSNYMAAWIDFNNDGDFMDGGEKITHSGPMNATTWHYSAINVPEVITPPTPNVAGPAGVQPGITRMRVREVFAQPAIDPCFNGYTYGETEDYYVTIIPNTCPSGVKLWLGYSDDWSDPTNWCMGLPSINDIVLIDEAGYLGGSQTGANFDPVIHSGTSAVAKSIRISGTDTLTVDAHSSATLQIADSLVISYDTPAGGGGKLIVNSSYADTVQLSESNLAFSLTPFSGTKRQQRSQFIYTKNFLLSKGLLGGDIVDELLFHFRATPGVAVGFGNFTIKYATVDSTWGITKFPSPPVASAPLTSAYVTLYTNPVFTIPVLPVSGGSLVISLLPGSFVWNGESDIVLEICYDRGNLPPATTDHSLYQSATTGSNEFLRITSTANSPSGCALNFPVVLPATAISSQYKPNITFKFHRPYNKCQINITGNGNSTAGNWINNGTFSAGRSVVTFNNSQLFQVIGGYNSTHFADLVIDKTGTITSKKVQLKINTVVDSTLTLTSGCIDLNRKKLTINNSKPSAITRTSGWIVSESVAPDYGILSWKIGTNQALHVFPFGTAFGNYIPVEFTNKGLNNANSKGVVSISTHKTTASNIPYPAASGPYGTSVKHLSAASTGLNISVTDVIDRFWMIHKTGTVTNDSAKIKFTYRTGIPTSGEEPAGGPFTYTAQRFQNPGIGGNPNGSWINKNGTNGTGSLTTTLFGDLINGPWTLANALNPLGDSLPPCGTIPPPVSVIPSSPVLLCSGSAYSLSAVSSGNSINWYTVPSGGTSIGSSASGAGFIITPIVNTTYYAETYTAAGCKSATRTATALITTKPLPAVVVTTTKSSICKNDSTTLSVSGGASFTWTPSTGLSGTTGTSVVAQPQTTTTYSVTGVSAFGCIKTVTKTITVKNIPTVSVIPAISTICPGSSQVLTASGTGVNYTWLPASGLNLTAGLSVIATPSVTTSYTVTAEKTNGCTATQTSQVKVTCPVSTTLTESNLGSNSVLLSWIGSTCATGYKLQYRISGTTTWSTININTNTTAYLLTGLQNLTTYEWKVATKCIGGVFANFSVKSFFTTTVFARLKPGTDYTEPSNISIFPNPAKDKINLIFNSGSDGPARLAVINRIGQEIIVHEITIRKGFYSEDLSIRFLSSGLYLIKIQQEKKINIARFIKE